MFNTYSNNKQQIIANLEAASGIFLSALAFILPLLYIDSLRDPSSLPRYTLYGISSGIILSLVLCKKLAEHKSPDFQKNLFLTVLVFLGWAWLSLSWSIDPKNSLLELIQLSGCIIIGFSISQITNLRILTFIIMSSVAGASIASAIGIAQYFDYNPLAYLQFSVPASTFTNPNIATTYIDLITPLAFVFIFIAKNKTYKSLATISSISCLSFLLLSHSRGSWLALIFVIIGLLFLINKNPNFKNTLYLQLAQHKSYLIIAIFIPFLLFFIPSTVSDLPVKNSQVAFDGSIKIRLHAYINSMSMLKDQPVTGTGYGGFKTGFRNYMFEAVPLSPVTEDKIYARLHNDLLQVFVELGFLGGLLFIYIYIVLLQACWLTIKKAKDSKIIFMMSGLFLAIIATGIHSSVDFPFHKPTSALQFWIWLGLISALSIKTIPVKFININRATVIIFIILGSIFSFYNYNYYQTYINASKYRLIAENSIKNGNCISARKNVDKMMDSFDADFRHQSLYVAVYSRCDIDNSEKLFAMNRILSYDQTNTRAYITRGTIYLQQKSTQKAINDFLQVTRILPHRASGYIGLAYASLQNQNQSAAVKLLKYATKVEPENEISSKLLKQIKLK
ncbi:MAG: O-antigen ligase family protein [Gammaproteobacteria bacterium]|nr:O-antigen ligase family protein [Gammaproteobacteria bacterium]